MRLKKILSLCLIIAIVVSCFNLVFAEDEVTVISVGKPITSIYYDGGNISYYDTTKPPSNANDGDTGTIYYSYFKENGDYATVEFTGMDKNTVFDMLLYDMSIENVDNYDSIYRRNS